MTASRTITEAIVSEINYLEQTEKRVPGQSRWERVWELYKGSVSSDEKEQEDTGRQICYSEYQVILDGAFRNVEIIFNFHPF